MPEVGTGTGYIKGRIFHKIPKGSSSKTVHIKSRMINLNDVSSTTVELAESPQEYLLIVPYGNRYVWVEADGRKLQQQQISVEAGQTKEGVDFSI